MAVSTSGLAVIARSGRPFLVGVLVLDVILAVGAHRNGWRPAWAMFAGMMGLAAAMLVLAVVVTMRHHASVLVARPDVPAFASPLSPVPVLTAAAVVAPMIDLAVGGMADVVVGGELWMLDAAFAVAMTVLAGGVVALQLYAVGRPVGVQLRPDGLYDRQPFGCRFIPWDAFVPQFPAVPVKANRLVLYVRSPDLIRIRGLHLGGTLTTTTSAPFLATAIHRYVTRPELRASIGAPAELHLLTAPVAA